LTLAVQKSQANRNKSVGLVSMSHTLAVQKSQANRNSPPMMNRRLGTLAVQKSQANRNRLEDEAPPRRDASSSEIAGQPQLIFRFVNLALHASSSEIAGQPQPRMR